MATFRGIFSTWDELKNKLTSLGFNINSNNRMRWGQAPSDTKCYWQLDDDNQTINFHASDNEWAFHDNLVHMQSSEDNKTKAGMIFIDLLDGGCMLYLTPIDADETSFENLFMTCYIDAQQKKSGDDATAHNNGIVVCTPAEDDGNWRYSWRHDAGASTSDAPDGIYPFDSSTSGHSKTAEGFFRWDIDDTQGWVSRGIELPIARTIPAQGSLVLVKSFLVTGYWSKYIYYVATGTINSDGVGTIFTINNQKYITFSDNSIWRCPVFKLPNDVITQNISTSTEEFSRYKLYAVDDYCIHDGLLYKCIKDITSPGSFDLADWKITTVYSEQYEN